MCGRFSQAKDADRYARLFGLTTDMRFRVRYNVAPSQAVLLCRVAEWGKWELVTLTWGLVPHWAKEPSTSYSTINARAETVATKPAYRDAFRQRRCLIPADGFYEWKPGKPRKQPHYIRRKDGEPFAFAGLWERWQRGEQRIESCTIIVTTANDVVAPIHDRMPVILDPAAYSRWLDPQSDQQTLQALLRPSSARDLEAYPVGFEVNDPVNDGPELIARRDR